MRSLTMKHKQLQPLNVPRPVAVTLDINGHPLMVFDNPSHLPIAPSHRGEEVQEMGEESEKCRLVEAVLEIWQIDDEWWREPISRRYVEVLLEGGRHVVLYEDLLTSNWFMQMV
jgi:hypothetical protein